jgi:putative flippase GtrA
MKYFDAAFLRFLMVGSFNTAAGYLVYLALLQVLHYQLAYALAYCIGIVVSYALNSRFVFRTRWSWDALLRYPIVYVVQYVAGAALLWILVDRLHLMPALGPLVVAAMLAPFSYLLAGKLIRWRRNGA